MTPEQKKHEEEYLAAKKRYETAYANKVKYTREKTAAETKKQQLIKSLQNVTPIFVVIKRKKCYNSDTVQVSV